jgi:D-arabinose 1-dehydrogenase-like Zn-dependent alcohol dehydrogenase
MRAVVIKEPGDVSKLQLDEVPLSSPSATQVSLKIAACGVCYRDIVDRLGGYPFMRRPVTTGHEFAGTVTAVGSAVSEWKPGDRVAVVHRAPCGDCAACKSGEETRCLTSPVMYGLTADGGYAEEALAWSASLVRVPDALPLEEAAFLHCTAGVALRALRHQAQLRAGESVLVTGASGGVGVHAVQIAKLLGARVVAVTSSPAKVDALRALGVDEVIVSSDGKFNKDAMRATDGGADVALELVGAPTFNGSLRSLRSGGRLVIVGNVTQERIDVNPGYLIVREIAVVGSAGASRADLAEVFAWAASGKLRPVVAARMKLDDARAAQEQLLRKGVVGRIVLVP